jgi:hypothetical protein
MKAFDLVNQEAQWFKVTTKGVSARFISCLSNFCEGTKFCIRYGDSEVTCFVTNKSVRHGCSSKLTFI